jgi:hypothetical protein
MRVWWIPQVPGEPFYVEVSGVKEARKILDTLAEYDAFLLKNKHRIAHFNTGGLEVMEENEWIEWRDSQGRDIDEE